jgi:tetratricopeptide (TPR) repeat protein
LQNRVLYMYKSFFCSIVISGIIYLLTSCANNSGEGSRQVIQTPTTAVVPEDLQKLNEKIKKDSSSASLYYARAKYYLNTRDFNASLIDMSRVMKLDSMKPDYYITLSDIYLFGNHTGKSKDALEKCLSLDPNNTDAMLKMAELYFYVKKYQESINFINGALKINNYMARAYFLKGLNFKEGGDTSKAISNLVTATEQDPDYFAAFAELGAIYAAKKNKLAIGYFDNALRINPKSLETLYNKGKFYQDEKNWDNAVNAYQELLKIEPQYKHAHYNLGAIALVSKSSYDEAIKHFSDAINLDPKYVEAYYARGTCYFQKGDMPKAKIDYQTAVQINPNFEPAVDALKAF